MFYKKIPVLILFLTVLGCGSIVYAENISLEKIFSGFDRHAQQEMKIDSARLVKGLKEEKILLVDVRFMEEIDKSPLPFGISMPLNDLPKRLVELPSDKLLVTACPVKDRAIIAMIYLRTNGFNVKYLNDGLIGITRYLKQRRFEL